MKHTLGTAVLFALTIVTIIALQNITASAASDPNACNGQATAYTT